jgi:hypothetical protein
MRIGCEIFIFILVFVVVAILYCIFLIVNPNDEYKRYNFAPFPTVKPPDIPIENYNQSDSPPDCLKSIQICSQDSDCSKCGDYECITVKEGENVVIDGKQLDKGKWCVPKGKKSLGCGTYTGRSIWSNVGGRQDWSCVCLYPDLFGGDDCLTQFACKDASIPLDKQPNNVLEDSKRNEWDPSKPDFYPPGGLSPYAKDESGNPIFTCRCDSVSDGVKYVSLPGDKYRCHADPCSTEHKISMWNPVTKSCDCPKDFAKSNTDGVCRDMQNYCGVGNSWDSTNNQCTCSTGSIVQNCSSNLYFREGAKPCTDPNNPGGSVCFEPCNTQNNPCQNGGACIVTESGNYCNCTSATGLVDPFVWGGDKCEKQCLKAETVIQKCKSDRGIKDCENPIYDNRFCCNGTYENTIYSVQGIREYEVRCI